MAIPITRGASVVIPSRDYLHLRCGTCGGMTFGVHVEPLAGGGAVAREVVCQGSEGNPGCRCVFRLRPDLTFERTGVDSDRS